MKKIILVQHENFDEIIPTEFSKVNADIPFYNFDGCMVKCNTRVFIEKLWNVYENEIGCFVDRRGVFDWEAYIKSWYETVNNNGLREILSGKMFYSISNFEKSGKYYLKCLKIVEKNGSPYSICQCHLSLGDVFQKMGKFGETIFHYNKALETVNISGYDPVYELEKANCYSSLGNVYLNLEHFGEAINNYTLALKIYKLLGTPGDEAKIFTSLGNCYLHLGNFAKAFEYLTKSLDIKIKCGDLVGIANCYGILGHYYNATNEPSKSVEYNTKSIECFKDLGMNNELGKGYANLSRSYNRLKKIEAELECLKEAEKIFVQIKNSGNLVVVLDQILGYACRENDLKLRKECEEKIKIVSSGKFYSL